MAPEELAPGIAALGSVFPTADEFHDDVRVYSIEAWAKHTGAADCGQALHRDDLDHTLLVTQR